MIHRKAGEESCNPLFGDDGVPLYPELMMELDAIKRVRIAGLMLPRDWGGHAPWPTFPKESEIDLIHMSRKVKEVIRAGWAARRTDLHVVPTLRVHRGGGCGFGSKPRAYEGQDAE